MIDHVKAVHEDTNKNQIAQTFELIQKIAEKIDGAAEIQISANDTRHMRISVIWSDGCKFSHIYAKELLEDSPEGAALDAFAHYANQARKAL